MLAGLLPSRACNHSGQIRGHKAYGKEDRCAVWESSSCTCLETSDFGRIQEPFCPWTCSNTDPGPATGSIQLNWLTSDRPPQSELALASLSCYCVLKSAVLVNWPTPWFVSSLKLGEVLPATRDLSVQSQAFPIAGLVPKLVD